jgi:hypothetical protein
MLPLTEDIPFHSLSLHLLRPLIYFDIFSYPLTKAEMFSYAQLPPSNHTERDYALQVLINKGIVKEVQGFYGVNLTQESIQKRIESNQRANQILPLAYKWAHFIGKFPFVRAVMLSGSISKNVMTDSGDIDYFVITQPGRLWVARTFLVLYRKIFLANSHQYFCTNYFVDIENLTIEDKNLFTATECITLLPAYGKEYYLPFMEANLWVYAFFSAPPSREAAHVPSFKRSFAQKLLETIFQGRWANAIEKYCMRLTFLHRKKSLRI